MKARTLIGRARRLGDPQVLAAAAVALVVEIGLAVSTVPRLAALLGIRLATDAGSEPASTAPGTLPAAWIGPRAVAVHRVLRRWPFGDTCLRRALVLGHRIRRLDPTLVIGVRHDEADRLAAHAWLVVNGTALDPLADQYFPLRTTTGGEQMRRYRLFDCVVASDVDLQVPEADPSLVPEMTLRCSAHPVDLDWEPKPDDILTSVSDEASGIHFVAARTPTGYRLRFGDLCDFDVSADLTDATWALLPGRDPGLVSILAAGALMAFRLIMAGHLVLHASAVRARGRGLAFVGASGMGKSTMATMMCAGGASMLTDDLARIDFDGRKALLSPGGTESRLRPAAAPLAELFDTTRVTTDGRTAVSLPCWTAGAVALDAVIIPLPSREHASIGLTTLTPPDALILLSQFPRLPGWVDTDVLRDQFNLLADLVDRVPVYTAVVPWGPPFAADTGERLLAALGWAL